MKPSYIPVVFLIIFAASCSSTIGVNSAPVAASVPSNETLQTWLSQNAFAVRSIDPLDEDFSDLEPLIAAIGTARVVQLGEPSHGAGSAFAAKVRLIKFLHQRMGFDVVAWESGLYELRLTQAALRTGEDPVAAAQRGIFTIWSNAEEVKPLFEYAKASHTGTRPLDMAGFDMQVTAAKSDERFAADLRGFADALTDPVLRARVSQLVDQANSGYTRLHTRSEPQGRPQKDDLQRFHTAVNDLRATIRNRRVAFERVHGAKEVTFAEHAIENMRARGVNAYDRERADPPTGAAADALNSERWNRRDTLMANNLRWLMHTGYPGRKIIVWGHNAHLMNAHFSADWRSVHTAPQRGGMTPTGALLAEWVKDDVYTIALTTYEGEDGWANGQNRGVIAPAVEGSVESRLHALGKPYVFLNLRGVKGDPGHPMRAPQSMRISGYGQPTGPYGNDMVPDLTKAFDAVFYIDRMAPATPIRK